MTRIISGEARGRTIKVPEHGTRPTSDRAREGLFSSLQVRFGFVGSRVLDLFAGSGALGLEAASRGADEVVLVENNPKAVQIIRHNMQVVGHPNVTVAEMKASTYVASAPKEYFDMVLADPPYDLPDSDIAEMLIALIPTLVDGAAVVVERHRESPETAWPSCFVPTTQKLKKRTFGIARMDMAVFHQELAAE
ncbi:16S rRNA (guanine(966)-N(2))-methyltransferase RsmD [Corynebacterium pseudotuberculosis]|uniref:16S rRNA (Guanine(966)-N(2))-methyltransferase RsmD n=1 Tax=Corynebacterium pseudotuberculosis (strain C231) TaxID=681645 RepID=D9QA24_CORP2|nr:16S rRNA (guanine(966)-N(2))-methyltransferase RsmD [Corynebacterium pseudotuberculosis]ADK28716.1 16S rRNA (guanine(966)-N(2))-methyltransferase RsmD [Corynebacterium pseudotuberculosis FRC41]ADL10400.1 16S rRNA (guanine(966)-N(2))-methyltransferase RsmD [Corynebacterium pseudotuberculosis C231]ADL20803.1 16S rRNA (guanine(966)-N(2))-methyltransferase RsmD [Corynebacterium pseudotuberculosis 1002]ADO26193.1 16S rRNA (guanine(966)-N(2))-methyltransferase RsmD [Corynebacterium pseudotuberculo